MAGDAERGRDAAGGIDANDRRLGTGVDRHAGRHRNAGADAGQLRVAGQADADPASRSARRFLVLAHRIIACGIAGCLQALLKRGAVPDDAGARAVGEFRGDHQVAAPHFSGVDAQSAGRHVDQALHGKGRRRTADATIGAGRGFRRQHALHRPVVVLEPIRAGHEAHHLHRLDGAGPGIDRIGADIADDGGAQAQQTPVGCDRQFRIHDLAEGLAGGGKILQPVAGPFDRAFQPDREGGNEQFFRVQRSFAAEAAADIGRNDSEAMAGKVKALAQGIADHAGNIGGAVQGQRAATAVPFREVAAVLDGNRSFAQHAEPGADVDRGGVERGGYVAALEFAHDDGVGAGLLVKQRRIRCRGRFGIAGKRQRLVLDGDMFERVFGDVAALGNDCHHRLADIAHLAACQGPEFGRIIVLHAGDRADRLDELFEIAGLEDGDHARHGKGIARFDCDDPRMRMVATAESHVQQSRRLSVIGIASTPSKQPRILNAPNRPPNQTRLPSHIRRQPAYGRKKFCFFFQKKRFLSVPNHRKPHPCAVPPTAPHHGRRPR